MTRVGIGFVAGVALLSSACMHGSRSGTAQAGSGQEGKMIATAAESGETSAPAGANAAPGAKKQVEGRVEIIDRADNLVLAGTEQVGRGFAHFKVDDDTKVTVKGEEATLSQVNPGDEVRASFSGEPGDLHVDQLDVLSSASAQGPGAPSPQGTGSSDPQQPAPQNDQGSGSSSQPSGSADQR